MRTVTGLRVSAVAAAFLVAAASCGGSPQVSPPESPEGASPAGVALASPPPPVSSTRPASTSTTASQGTQVPDGGSPSTVPSVVGSSTTLPFVSSTALLAPGASVCCVSWSTEELAGVFEERLRAFKDLSEPKYDTSTPLGEFCWAWWEVKHAAAYEAALEGRFSDEGRADNGTVFTALREALADRARRGDTEATQVLWDAADVRKPGEGYSLASVVESVNAPGVRAAALSVDDVELRSAAEALFAWVDEYEQNTVAGNTALEGGLVDADLCPLPPVPELTAAEETLTIEEIRALTREEVESLTPEQLKDIDVNAAFDGGLLLRDFPRDLQLAWEEKSFMKSAEYIRARCCYSLTTEELVANLTVSEESHGDYGESLPSPLEALEEYSRNENDPSTPIGAFCWAFLETYRSFFLHWLGYTYETMVDLYREELLARAEMGDAAAADAVREMPLETPSGEYPFADALEAVGDSRVRGTAFKAEDPVLLDVVGVFYGLVDEVRQAGASSPYVFMAEFLPYISPGFFLQSGSEDQPLEPEGQARESLLEECRIPGEDW